jgi:CheY-like chemotaxis protein
VRSKAVILHVEDDPNDVLLVGLAFRKSGVPATLQVVNDGEQAVQYLAGQGPYSDRQIFPLPALVLLDLKLPRRSGLEVLSWVRGQEDLRRLPVIMLTSSNQQADVTRAYDIGLNSYLVKPSALEELIETVRKACSYWLELNIAPCIRKDLL